MELTLSKVAQNPNSARYSASLDNGEQVVLRPLEVKDVAKLASFLSRLSKETRRLSTFDGYDINTAQTLCDAISKYDKLRFVVETEKLDRIIGLIEFSFGLPDSDIARFHKAGCELNTATDCRFGPTLADDYQSKGLGSELMPFVIDVVKRFDKKRIILWGGVLKDNKRAIRFYKKFGFKKVGEFATDGLSKIDMILNLEDI